MASGGNAQRGGSVASGGQTGEGGNTDGGGATAGGSGGVGFIVSLSAGGVISLAGIASSGQDGGDSPDGLCENTMMIWVAIRVYLAGTGSCAPIPDGEAGSGNIVIDSEGQVIDITKSGVSKTEPVEALAGLRWPCLAGQTIPYSCQNGED